MARLYDPVVTEPGQNPTRSHEGSLGKLEIDRTQWKRKEDLVSVLEKEETGLLSRRSSDKTQNRPLETRHVFDMLHYVTGTDSSVE